jgi:hypothetical protein
MLCNWRSDRSGHPKRSRIKPASCDGTFMVPTAALLKAISWRFMMKYDKS